MNIYNFTPTKDFFYSKGRAKTEKPWYRPDPILLNSWKEEFFNNYKLLGDYKFFLHGAALFGSRTWDVDIMVKSINPEKINLDNLEEVMYKATQLGFNHRQLIDIHLIEMPEECWSRPICDHSDIACNQFLETGRCDLDPCYEETKTRMTKIIKYGRQVTFGDDVHNCNFINGAEQKYYKELLITVNPLQEKVKKKIYEKMKKQLINKSSVEIKENTDFRKHIAWQ